MKKIFINNMSGLILIAAFALVGSSCQKEQVLKTNLNEADVQSMLSDANASAVSACTGPIPEILKVPAGNKLVLQTYATGVQIYQVKRSTVDTNSFSWVGVAPLATVYAKPDFTNQLALHYAGPSWEFTKGQFKGEKVVGVKEQGITVDLTAVQWLRLKAVDSLSSPGNKITYIQRVCTSGGLPPTTPANAGNVGTLDSIPYTTAYFFYTKS